MLSTVEVLLLKGLPVPVEIHNLNNLVNDKSSIWEDSFLKLYVEWKHDHVSLLDTFFGYFGYAGKAFQEDQLESKRHAHKLIAACALLKVYVQGNYTGPCLTLTKEQTSWLEECAKTEYKNEILFDGEDIQENIKWPVLLAIAWRHLNMIDEALVPSVIWWKMRVAILHQKMLEQRSTVIWARIESLFPALEQFRDSKTEGLATLLSCELAEVHLYHFDVRNAQTCLSKAEDECGIRIKEVGLMGKRTKFQQEAVSQLAVEIESLDDAVDEPEVDKGYRKELESSNSPKTVRLQDDTLLDEVEFIDSGAQPRPVSALQEVVLVTKLNYIKRSQARDELYHQSLRAYARRLLNSKLWTTQMLALLNRSLSETDNKRTVERSMEQFQELKFALKYGQPTFNARYQFFYGVGFPFTWEIERSLAEVELSLGLVQSALDIFLQLRNWEEAIKCYHLLDLKHKAEEVIREELDKGESVKLWIYLGDATGQEDCYEKAWNLSKETSSLAQKHWGYLHFSRRHFEEAAKHLEKSVDLNYLQNPVWIRLGYCAMQIQNWELCARAYRHSSTLDYDNFEVWNNLAHAYIKMDEKTRALRVLLEAIRCNYDNWRVWDNLLVVAVDCRAFDEVIRAYHRLLDLKARHEDEEVLTVLTRSIWHNVEDFEGNPSFKYRDNALKLFGRLSASVTTKPWIWRLYSDLQIAGCTEKWEDSQEKLQMIWHRCLDSGEKAIRCAILDTSWTSVPEKVELVVEYIDSFAQKVIAYVLKFHGCIDGNKFLGTALEFNKRILGQLQKKVERMVSPAYEDYVTKLGKIDNQLKVITTTASH